MGNAAAQKTAELAEAIQQGDTPRAADMLNRLTAARQSQASNREQKALQALDLNSHVVDGLALLHLAARARSVDLVRILLEVPASPAGPGPADPNVLSEHQSTPLHVVAKHNSPPNCTACVRELLRRRADPLMQSSNGTTPLDLARCAKCTACVVELEASAALWQGWVDHYEWRGLVPSWTSKWLVVHLDKRPNSGPSFLSRGNMNAAWQGLRNFVGAQIKSPPVNACPSCRNPVTVPDFVPIFRCSSCNMELAVPASLQLAIYAETEPGSRLNQSDDSPRPELAIPALVQRLPYGRQLEVRRIDGGTWEGTMNSLKQGRLGRAIQSSVGSARQHGVGIKVKSPAGDILADYSFRFSREMDQKNVVEILQDPVLASPSAVSAAVHKLLVASHRHVAEHVEEPQQFVGQGIDLQPSAPPKPSNIAGVPVTPSAEQQALGIDPFSNSGQASVLEPEEDDGMCIVCMERRADTAVVPCGHVCRCVACLEMVKQQQQPQCPMCRGPVQSTMRIYFN